MADRDRCGPGLFIIGKGYSRWFSVPSMSALILLAGPPPMCGCADEAVGSEFGGRITYDPVIAGGPSKPDDIL
jgi:hypothetical protein